MAWFDRLCTMIGAWSKVFPWRLPSTKHELRARRPYLISHTLSWAGWLERLILPYCCPTSLPFRHIAVLCELSASLGTIYSNIDLNIQNFYYNVKWKNLTELFDYYDCLGLLPSVSPSLKPHVAHLYYIAIKLHIYLRRLDSHRAPMTYVHIRSKSWRPYTLSCSELPECYYITSGLL